MDAEAGGPTAAPAILPLDQLEGGTEAAPWFDSLASGGAPSGTRLHLRPAQHGSAAAAMHPLQPASTSRTFSSFAGYADQHTNGGHAQHHQPQPPPQMLSLQLPHPWFEAGSVAGTPREATVADNSYGWASDTAALDGDSADGASPHGRACNAAGAREFGGVTSAVLALQATGGEIAAAAFRSLADQSA